VQKLEKYNYPTIIYLVKKIICLFECFASKYLSPLLIIVLIKDIFNKLIATLLKKIRNIATTVMYVFTKDLLNGMFGVK
jgi:hypothetical protein